MRTIKYLNLGLSEYGKTWDYQEQLMAEIIAIKLANMTSVEVVKAPTPNYLILVEHPPVYTLGKSGKENNLFLNEEQLRSRGIGFYKTNRGGDITFHGPGQLVGYPVLDLENFGLSLRHYIYSIEEVVIQVLAGYGLEGKRDPKATGVWLFSGEGPARKICAIGVKSSRYVTMHGFALNINTDLTYFHNINPCGLIDKTVTSMEKELGTRVDFEEVKKTVLAGFLTIFDAQLL